MPDLMPDTGIYKQQGQTPLSIGDILSLSLKARELQNQQAISGAINKNVTPEGVVGPGAVQQYTKSPYATPEGVQGLTAAQQAQVKAATDNAAMAANAFVGLIGKKNATVDDLMTVMPLIRTIPKEQRNEIAQALVGPDGKHLDQDKLATFHSALRNQAQLPTTEITTSTGQKELRPSVEINRAMATGQGIPTSLSADADTSIKASNLAKDRGRTYQTDIYPYEQALGIMEKMEAKDQTLGPGTHGRNVAESFLQALSPTVAKMAGVDPEKIRDYSEVEKYLTQGTQARAGQWGAHTDAQFASTVSGTPNVHVTDLAGVPLVKAGLSIRSMDHAQDYLSSQLGDANFLKESFRLSPKMDPRPFAMKYAKPDAVAKMQSELKGTDRAKFNANLAAGILSGSIPNNTGLSSEQLQGLVSKYFYQNK